MADCWFPHEVRRLIKATRIAGQAAQAEMDTTPAELAAYWRGYEAALATIAAAFGVERSASDEVRDIVNDLDW